MILAKNVRSVPDHVRPRLREAARETAKQRATVPGGGASADGAAADCLAVALTGVDEAALQEQLVPLLRHGDAAREDVANYLADRAEHVSILEILTTDSNAAVAETAVYGLTRSIGTAGDAAGRVELVNELLTTNSSWGSAVVAGLESIDSLPPEAGGVIKHLREHPSVTVRKRAEDLRVGSDKS